MKTSLCRSCGAEIIWTKTKNDKLMPVDMKPTGTAVMLDDSADPPFSWVMPTYESHFVTCPSAAEHRAS